MRARKIYALYTNRKIPKRVKILRDGSSYQVTDHLLLFETSQSFPDLGNDIMTLLQKHKIWGLLVNLTEDGTGYSFGGLPAAAEWLQART